LSGIILDQENKKITQSISESIISLFILLLLLLLFFFFFFFFFLLGDFFKKP